MDWKINLIEIEDVNIHILSPFGHSKVIIFIIRINYFRKKKRTKNMD